MIFLDLFFSFLEIGLFSFGGGYGIIPLLRSVTIQKGWLTSKELLEIIAVSESTPGPIAVNLATYVGSIKGGLFGSILATVGVILPAFIIILLLYKVLTRVNENKRLKAFLTGVQPVIVALILSIGLVMTVECIFFNMKSISGEFSFNLARLLIILSLIAFEILHKIFKKKFVSPILLIIIGAILGIIFL